METSTGPTGTDAAGTPRKRIRDQAWIYLFAGAAILGLDFLTGPYLQFPILFVIPVALAGWYHGMRLACVLAVVLPLGRLYIALFVDVTAPAEFAMVNAATRIAVLVLLAYLVARTARQTRALEERLSDLVRICAWSRTVEYEGEWLSFEDYLKRRFRLETTHGVSPAELQRLTAQIRSGAPAGTGGSGRN